MHHQLTNKYQETPSSPSRSDQSAPIEYASGSLTDVLVSISLSPGQLALNVPHWLTILKSNESLMSRTSTHLILLFLAVVAISLRAVPLSWNEVKAIQPLKYLPEEAAVIPATETEQQNIPLTLPTALNDTEDDVLIRAAVPHTIIPDRSRAEISTYTVQGGDTVFGIAAKFGLTPETILWANSDLEDNPDWLAVGRELTILPVSGVYHQVGGGVVVGGAVVVGAIVVVVEMVGGPVAVEAQAVRTARHE